MTILKEMLIELKQHGWKQREIAKYLGVSDAVISYAINGHTKNMIFGTGRKVEELYKKEKRIWK